MKGGQTKYFIEPPSEGVDPPPPPHWAIIKADCWPVSLIWAAPTQRAYIPCGLPLSPLLSGLGRAHLGMAFHRPAVNWLGADVITAFVSDRITC